ncbi:MAG: oxidoreductase [Fervidobacterium pennivorans]|uniref:Oxidoreductase n=1 Tax=Fervidobacterium pennivorans TaxID=93466 RepID=A0A172T212_FERPE|nr:oxidoreductase [Fervidobacterium pennivorans]ANE41039.1 oxidoreductase [Fervidobacterium pennivorans]
MANFSVEVKKQTKYKAFLLTKRSVEEITQNTYLITFEEDFDFLPGQFCMVSVDGAGLTRKPYTLGRLNKMELAISVKIAGKGSEYIVKTNEKLNVLAPLGNPFVPESGNGAVIVAPSCLAEGIHLSEHFDIPLIVASRTELNDKIVKKLKMKVVVGNEGFLNLLSELNHSFYDWIFVSGSKVMEELAVKNMPNKVVYVSLNEYMACGIGACKGCAVETIHGIKHVCTDGPVFRGDNVWQVQRHSN